MPVVPLHTLAFDAVTACFNEGFSDYIVPMVTTEAALRKRWDEAGVRLQDSVAFLAGTKPVGLMAIAIEMVGHKRVAYNAGTGVIPAFRRQGVVTQMSAALDNVFLKRRVDECVLEVICANAAAIKTYERLGFHQRRVLRCFRRQRGKQIPLPSKFAVRAMAPPAWEQFAAWAPAPWAWESTAPCIRRMGDDVEISCFGHGATEVGFCLFRARDRRLLQWGFDAEVSIEDRAALLGSVLGDGEATALNVDGRDASSAAVLEKLGFANTIDQFEMSTVAATTAPHPS